MMIFVQFFPYSFFRIILLISVFVCGLLGLHCCSDFFLAAERGPFSSFGAQTPHCVGFPVVERWPWSAGPRMQPR